MKSKIFIADDESDIVSMLDCFFKSKGYGVLTALNGIETLKQAERKPDIILLDINMPGLDGLEVCKRIRKHVSCPILFLTAKIEETDKVNGFAVGGDDYIIKPFSLVELEARISAHLRREARHQKETRIKFSGSFLLTIPNGLSTSRKIKLPWSKRNLILWSYYHKMLARSLIRNGFMKEYGTMIAQVIAT